MNILGGASLLVEDDAPSVIDLSTLKLFQFACNGSRRCAACSLFSLRSVVERMSRGDSPKVKKSLQFAGLVGETSSLLKDVPRILPILSVTMVVLYLVFVTLIMLYEQGVVSRSTPVIWEWLAILSSIVWTMAQSILLGIWD
jgi:hypothetical protein